MEYLYPVMKERRSSPDGTSELEETVCGIFTFLVLGLSGTWVIFDCATNRGGERENHGRNLKIVVNC